MPIQKPRSVMQKVKDRTKDIDAALDAQTGFKRAPSGSDSIGPYKAGSAGSTARPPRAKESSTSTFTPPGKGLRRSTPVKKRR